VTLHILTAAILFDSIAVLQRSRALLLLLLMFSQVDNLPLLDVVGSIAAP